MEAAPASRGDPLPLFREGNHFIPNTMLYYDNFVLSPVLAFFLTGSHFLSRQALLFLTSKFIFLMGFLICYKLSISAPSEDRLW